MHVRCKLLHREDHVVKSTSIFTFARQTDALLETSFHRPKNLSTLSKDKHV